MSISLCFLLSIGMANAQTIRDIRSHFHQAVLDPEKSPDFYEFIQKTDLTTATVKAYKAVSEAMMARAFWNPFSKLSQVKKYDLMMSEAVALDSNNIEIRFLRLAIEYNLPRFLGYSVHLEDDTNMIIENLSKINVLQIDSSFGRYILYFLRNTGLCDSSQIELMEAAFEESVSKN